MLPPLVEKKLQQLAIRHAELETLLATPDVIQQQSAYRAHSKELGVVSKKVTKYQDLLRASKERAENDELGRTPGEDPALRQLAKEEVARLDPIVKRLEDELVEAVLVEDKEASRNAILEIRAGVGGDEAALFAGDLFRMYSKYSERRGWKVEVMDASPTDLGGFKEIVISVTGDFVHRDLRYEMGGHRVQRVPATEASGRIHTSAATVAVLSEPEEVDIDVKESDIRMDFYRAGGPGGQNVNKTSSAVRLTHIPTGLVVAIQEESSQHKNRARAMRVLRSRLYDLYESQRKEKEQSTRRTQIGSGDRSQRIRTYNFPQNRVTDHRINENFNLERIVQEGDIEELIKALRGYDRDQRIKEL
jgi:peptide chain release factor 1